MRDNGTLEGISSLHVACKREDTCRAVDGATVLFCQFVITLGRRMAWYG
jgi:hypothetical protein